MTTVNLSCTICQENYGSSDEVISTFCGHIFHRSCFQQWHSENRTCPECRVQNVQSHRVFLHMEDPSERDTTQRTRKAREGTIFGRKTEKFEELESEIVCLKVQNKSFEEEFSKLEIKLKESERNFTDLFEQVSQGAASITSRGGCGQCVCCLCGCGQCYCCFCRKQKI